MAISSRLASRATGSTLFFTNLLRLNRSPSVVATTRSLVALSIHTGAPKNYPDKETLNPVTTCGHSFNSSPIPEDEDREEEEVDGDDMDPRRKIVGKSITAFMNHPFLTQGSRVMHCEVEYLQETILKVDMPGIGEDGLNLEIIKNAIHIEGKAAEKEVEDDEDEDKLERRIYSLVVDLPPGLYNTHQIEVFLKFGVLKIVIPKLKPEARTETPPYRGIRVRATRLSERLN